MPTPDLVAEICVWKNIMNKRFTTLMTTLILSVFFAISASAYDVEVDGVYYKVIKKGKIAKVTAGDYTYSYKGSIVIPPSIVVDGVECKIIEIEDGAFYYSSISSVKIPNTVTKIGNCAFCKSSIMEIEIPNSVKEIGYRTFYECNYLNSIKLPNSIKAIGDEAFMNCQYLDIISFPNSLEHIGNKAFMNCPTITYITIPNSVISIGESAFEDCTGLYSVSLSNSMKRISNRLFYGCGCLYSVNIPNSIISIGELAFGLCVKLDNLLIPSSVINIEKRAFSNCTALKSLDIPISVTSIGESAFEFCDKINSLKISNSIDSIKKNAFFGCNKIPTVIIPNSVTSIGNYAFSCCENITKLYLPSTLNEIGDAAFGYCKNLSEIYCYAESIPNLGKEIFESNNIEKITLYVPESSYEYFKKTAPWSSFGNIKVLKNTDYYKERTEMPILSYKDGQLQFICHTDNTQCFYNITVSDDTKEEISLSNNIVQLSRCYDITYYAVSEGHPKSENSLVKLYWLPSSGKIEIDSGLNPLKMKGLFVTCSNGIISIFGLYDGDNVEFYSIDGVMLGKKKSANGKVDISLHNNIETLIIKTRLGNIKIFSK